MIKQYEYASQNSICYFRYFSKHFLVIYFNNITVQIYHRKKRLESCSVISEDKEWEDACKRHVFVVKCTQKEQTFPKKLFGI